MNSAVDKSRFSSSRLVCILPDFLFSNCPSWYSPLSFCLSLYSQVFFASLLHPLSSPPPFFSGCRVMYGPRQHWDQWDASCFNLAPEPGRSRSGASWKSDGTGLSPPPCPPCPPPTPLLPCAGLINTFLLLVSRGGDQWERRRTHLLVDWGRCAPSPCLRILSGISCPSTSRLMCRSAGPILIRLRIDPKQPDRRTNNEGLSESLDLPLLTAPLLLLSHITCPLFHHFLSIISSCVPRWQSWENAFMQS